MRHTGKTVATILLASLLAACEDPPAWGDQNAIIAITSDDQWAAVGEMVESALETTIVTVRAEKTFRVTHQAPMGQGWGNLQRFRKLLLIGAADSPWMVDALALSGRESFNPPEIFQVEDVWAKGQTATVLLLPSEGAARAEEMMEPLHELLDGFGDEILVLAIPDGRICADHL